jgi:hypothetical protein
MIMINHFFCLPSLKTSYLLRKQLFFNKFNSKPVGVIFKRVKVEAQAAGEEDWVLGYYG